MPYGVDAPVNPVQAPGENPASHRVFAHARIAHLGKANHSMLLLGDTGNQCVG